MGGEPRVAEIDWRTQSGKHGMLDLEADLTCRTKVAEQNNVFLYPQ